jgi:tetratricopeptide (TPR) repeat protein
MRCRTSLSHRMRIRALLLTLVLPLAHAQVRVWEGTLTLPTYEEGPPDPNPPFDQFASGRFNYPYTLRHNLTARRAPHDWRAVYLENEYLKCSVLPDIGGHLYTCVDKLSGQPMFYANPSIKKADIGYRGAWAAFGIEFNFPISHNWVSMSPVGYSFATHPDGSASVVVGNIDRVYGMEWLVELRLRPASTVLEEHVTLNNRDDVRHRFYWWNNAGVEVKDDSRIDYPMRFTASHGFKDIDSWPVDSTGKDLSVIRNQTDGPVSRFVYGSREPFMGVWRPDTNTGLAHYAEYAELPAKKIWSWGVDADGLDWRRALSDNDSAYVEVQAGLFRNQETYAFLEPRQTIKFSEYWMPARAIGGITRANLAGVLYLGRTNGMLAARFNANHKIPNASIRVLQDSRVVAEETTELSPERMWSGEFRDVGNAPCTFELKGNSALLLRQTEGEYDWTPAAEVHAGPQPQHQLPDPEHRGTSDWVESGTEQELNGELLAAFGTYQEGLRRFPAAFELLVAAGRLAAALERYDEAIKYLEPAYARATSDPEVAYYLGLAYEGAGDSRKARLLLEAAARLPSFRAAASLRLGELLAREGDGQRALEVLRAADSDLRAAEETIAMERATGLTSAANVHARQWLGRQPSAFLSWDSAEVPDPALLRYLAADPARVLRIAAEYMRLGLYVRALDLLGVQFPAVPADHTEPGAVLPQQYPMVLYYRGYCRQKLGQSGSADYAAASQLSMLYVFPSGPESAEVLRAALHEHPDDAAAHYLLGTYLFSRGLTDTALAQWNDARRLNAKIPVLHADLGRLLLREMHNYTGALTAFREGLAVDGENLELYTGIDQTMSLMGRPARERATALERYPDPNMPAELVYALALDRAEGSDFAGATALFRDRFFPREEGGTNVRQVWVEVKMMEALSQAAGGHCEAALAGADSVGKEVPGVAFTRDGLEPFLRGARMQYLLAEVEAHCGRATQAAERWRRVAAATGVADIIWARAAAKKLDGYNEAEWHARLQTALARVDGDSPYTIGAIEATLGERAASQAHFRDALLLPDQHLSHHLTRLALAGTGLPQ